MNYGRIPFEVSQIPFKKLHTLEIEGIKYQIHVNKMIQLLRMSPTLKVLKIFWIGNHAISNEMYKAIFEVAKSLEELHLGSSIDTFNISDEALSIIKNNSGNLRKIKVFTDDIERMRKKMKMLNHIQCTALSKKYENITEEEEAKSSRKTTKKYKMPSTCIWSE